MSNANDITKRLASVLAELTSLPTSEAESVTANAVSEAYQEVGCGLREDLVHLVLLMAEQATDNGHADKADLCDFYAEEAEFKDSDHKPKDCREWSRGYGKACKAYGKANLALLKIRTTLAKRIQQADL
jgi:hypothetical protein